LGLQPLVEAVQLYIHEGGLELVVALRDQHSSALAVDVADAGDLA